LLPCDARAANVRRGAAKATADAQEDSAAAATRPLSITAARML
jgi:hypothetical protein